MPKMDSNTIKKEKEEKENSKPLEVSKFRRILPQVLAATAKNFLLLDLGLAAAFPTVIIPSLTGISKNSDQFETIKLTAEQASWLGSIPYICQPIGSLLSGLLTEPIGRKKSMILVNIPHIIAWIMLHYASTLTEVFIAVVLLGLGIGFMEAPIVTYVGEISEPSIRGVLTCCAGVSVMIGVTLVYFLGTVTVWRTTALICLSVPIATMIAICFIPETPMWLLSKNYKEKALESLQWLRGWVSPKAVEKEFEEICRYSDNSNKCAPCQKSNTKCGHPPANLKDKLAELIRKRTLKPFTLLIMYFALAQFSGIHAMRPYLVQIFKAYRIPIDPNAATVVTGILGMIANIVCMILIGIVGKRRMSLFSLLGTMIACTSLGFYSFNNLPHDLSSFNIPTYEYGQESAMPMILFFVLSFFSSVGVSSIPWMLLSEVFPFKSRGFATGITAALNYIMSFITTKTYLNLEKALGLYGAIWAYGSVAAVGLAFIYFLLPETERRSLEDIETHFSNNKLKLTDIKITKSSKIKQNENVVENGNTKDKTDSTRITKDKLNMENELNAKTINGCDNKAFEDN